MTTTAKDWTALLASTRNWRERLHLQIDKRAGADACWPWTGGTRKGYGAMTRAGKKRGAHIFAWIDANGREVPDGLVVMHSCDNPPCCNPAHLSLGTRRDNMLDRERKGRGNRWASRRPLKAAS